MSDPNMQMPQGMNSTQSQGQAPAPRPEQSKGKKQTADAQVFDNMTKSVNLVGASLRILEERYALMRNKSQVTEESMIDLEKGLSKDLKVMNDDITELKHQLKDIIDKLRLIDAEMKNLSKKEELKVLERYLDMWQPMNFVTRNELDKLVDEKKRLQQIPPK